MDRKEEFAQDVRVIDRAQGRHDGNALVAAASVLLDKVAALRKRLAAGDRGAIDEALDLLEIRQPVIWVGYAQEKLFRSLKQADLDGSHVGRLEFLALQLVSSPLQGGQLRELLRVLRGRATPPLLSRLKELTANHEDRTRRRATRALSVLVAAEARATRPGRTKHPRSRRPTTR